MFKKCLLALSVVSLLAVGAASAKADRCYRDRAYYGARYSSPAPYYGGGYSRGRHAHHSYYSPYSPPYAYRGGYTYDHGRRYTHAPAPSRGGFYLSIGL